MDIKQICGVRSIVAAVVVATALIGVLGSNSMAQIPFSKEQFTAFTGKGERVEIENVVAAMNDADVLFLGELHDDAVAHAIQLEVFSQLIAKYAASRRMVLSLEMFERDVQVVLDEYLNGLISENHFMLSSRPWGNYKTDYRPLVEIAKERKFEVVAANAPRRYVNMVSRNGRQSLAGLSAEAKNWLPPLPYSEASEAYSAKFRSLMGGSPESSMGLENILSAQSLWDASMAYWIARSLAKDKKGLVVHLNGSFHTENRLGTVEHLARYRPEVKMLVVTMRTEENFKEFDEKRHGGAGDFVILTDTKVPRSKR